MVPLSLSLRNFLSYGERPTVLDFSQFGVACLSGENGHGKSALLDAITFALWGEARKGRSERKPDEGLLRAGATEMRVEFCFDLDGDRYRIIRSYRRGNRGGSSQLDLQIYSPAHRGYRSLTEGNSNTRTQERVGQILSMDYETFINSAFIVQGRINEFSNKDPGQRKRILGEILGLSRYDRMQEQARRRLTHANGLVDGLDKRRLELDSALTGRDELRSQMARVDDGLATLASIIETDDRRLLEARTGLARRAQMRRQRETLARDKSDLEFRRRELSAQRDDLKTQISDDSALIDSGEQIAESYEQYQRLDRQEQVLRVAAARYRQLEGEYHQVQSELSVKRRHAEERRAFCAAKVQSLSQQLERFRAALGARATVEERCEELVAARREEELMQSKRSSRDRLDRETERIFQQIEMEARRLTDSVTRIRERESQVRFQLQTSLSLEEEKHRLEQQIGSLKLLERDRERIREQGTDLRVQLAEAERQLTGIQVSVNEIKEKTAILDRSNEANCPLCGSKLDDEHELQLRNELQKSEDELQMRIGSQKDEYDQKKGRVETLRSEFKRLEDATSPTREIETRLSQLRAELAQAAEGRKELAELDGEALELERRLACGEFAPDLREKSRCVLDELSTLDYREEEHSRVRERITLLAGAEVDAARLRDAVDGERETERALTCATQELVQAETILEGVHYAESEQSRLQELQGTLDRLAYDPSGHDELRQELDHLKNAEWEYSRLSSARDRNQKNARQLERWDRELKLLCERLNVVANSAQALDAELREMADLETAEKEVCVRLRDKRLEREGLLQTRGSLLSRRDRLEELATERETVQAEIRRVREEAWLCERLTEAFGRDGIQALIMENTLPEIEEEANAILARLTDNRIQITIESLRDLKKGGTKETMDIKIADELGERPYDLFSGGETFRTDFALRIALSKVLARRAGTQLRTLIVDEGFGTQDSQGLEQLIQAIQHIAKDFEMVLVVTHLEQLKNAFPVRIEVTKHPELGSQIEVIHSA